MLGKFFPVVTSLALAGALTRMELLPEQSSGERESGWSGNWADWDNEGHNDWQNDAPSPPGGK